MRDNFSNGTLEPRMRRKLTSSCKWFAQIAHRPWTSQCLCEGYLPEEHVVQRPQKGQELRTAGFSGFVYVGSFMHIIPPNSGA